MLALAAAALISLGGAATARAADPPGAEALQKARAAWDKSALVKAEAGYRDALEKGGLAPDEVLEGYVRLGTVRALRGKKEQALAAFRAAAVIDNTFSVPRVGGAKTRALADRAKKDMATFGSIEFKTNAPKETPAGKAFKVTATIDKNHVGGIVKKVSLVAKDAASGKEATAEAEAAETTTLEVPASVVLHNASIIIRFDALDANSNRLASMEERVRVLEEEPATAPAAVASTPAVTTVPAPKASFSDVPPPRESEKKKGGFWSSPWPYIVGSAALAGAGAAVYFGTRPPDNVNVGQVGVRTL